MMRERLKDYKSMETLSILLSQFFPVKKELIPKVADILDRYLHSILNMSSIYEDKKEVIDRQFYENKVVSIVDNLPGTFGGTA